MLQFLILSATRSGEARGVMWSEIDLQSATWSIPRERIKASRPNRVPLSPQAVKLLKNQPKFEGIDLISLAGVTSRCRTWR